jgi:hypothetical protein
MRHRKPPVVLHGCRVEQFALRDRSIRFAGHGLLFSAGKEVGAVPRLALARDRSGEVMLFHCDYRWRVVGASGGWRTVREAKKRAERFYPGISRVWRSTGYTKAQTARQLDRTNRRCSVCAKFWFEVDKMVVTKKARFTLCDACIRQFYEVISVESVPAVPERP